MTRPWTSAALAVALALTITACGGGGGGGDDVATLGADAARDEDSTSGGDGGEVTEAEREDAMLEFSECMREHGVDLPDPVISGGGNERSVTVRGGPGEAIDPEEFEAANEACRDIIEDVMGERPQLSPEEEAEMRDRMLAYAECMREHGVDMPDPEFSDGGGMVRIGPGEGMDPSDDDFQAAEEACRGELGFDDEGGPGGGPGMVFESSAAAGSES